MIFFFFSFPAPPVTYFERATRRINPLPHKLTRFSRPISAYAIDPPISSFFSHISFCSCAHNYLKLPWTNCLQRAVFFEKINAVGGEWQTEETNKGAEGATNDNSIATRAGHPCTRNSGSYTELSQQGNLLCASTLTISWQARIRALPGFDWPLTSALALRLFII